MSKFFVWFGRSRKAIAAVVTPALAWSTLIAAQPGSFTRITAVEYVSLAIGLATGLGVYQASNDPIPTKTPSGALLPPPLDAPPAA